MLGCSYFYKVWTVLLQMGHTELLAKRVAEDGCDVREIYNLISRGEILYNMCYFRGKKMDKITITDSYGSFDLCRDKAGIGLTKPEDSCLDPFDFISYSLSDRGEMSDDARSLFKEGIEKLIKLKCSVKN